MESRTDIAPWSGLAQSPSVRTAISCITTRMSPAHSDAYSINHINTDAPNWERACVVQIERGNPEAFDHLVHHYSARIYAHLFRMIRSREEAEDLTQETFVLAYRKLDSYDRARPFRNWIYAIATNVAKNALRTRSRRIPSAREDQNEEAFSANDQSTNLHEARELKAQLAAAVDHLPEPLPMLIHLHYREGFTIREAAQILQMTEGAAKVALHRARKTLRTILEKDES